jgi:hypothetical protein
MLPGTRASAAKPTVPQRIDRLIDAQLRKDGVPSSPRSNDAEFQRRAYLDLTGRLPPTATVADFLDSKEPDKRAKLIDDLLASPGYGQHLARYWAELLVKRDGEQNKRLKTDAFRTWLADEFNKGRGWDGIITDMLTVEGEGPAGFVFQANRLNGDRPSPAKMIGATANLFLGVQLQCAECHDHPFATWKRTEFWELAAFFGRTRFEKGATKGIQKLTEEEPPPPDPAAKGRPGFRPPAGGKIDIPDALDAKIVAATVTAKLPGQPQPMLSEHGPYRPLYAAWLTDPKNAWFARAAVNRYWSILFARGLVNPLDDMNPDNTATHPELLDFLATEFARSGYDLKSLLRSICLSEAYQRSSRVTDENRDHDGYARMPVKFLQGEVLLKCLDQVLGVEVILPVKNKKEVVTAIPNAELLDTSGYDESASLYSFGAPQLLRLMNAEIPRRAPALIAKLQDGNPEPDKMVERLFLLTLARRPTAEETKDMLALVKASREPAKGYTAVLWILLNTAEFIANP